MSSATRSNRNLGTKQSRRSKKTALRLHFSTDSVTETDRPATPRPASRSSVCTLFQNAMPRAVIDKISRSGSSGRDHLADSRDMGSYLDQNLDRKRKVRRSSAQRPYLPRVLLTISPRSDVPTNDSAFYDLLTGILKSLVLLQGSDLEKTKVVLLAGLLFNRLWANASEIPEVIQAIQASYQASGSHVVDLWTALIQIVLNRNPASSPRLNLQWVPVFEAPRSCWRS